jgi:hypothetical protein
MGIDATHLDRLLPRHDPAINLDLSWNVRVVRTGVFKQHREEVSAAAWIRDISLEGALIEVPDNNVHDIGDYIDVRFRGLDGRAKIRHCRRGDDGMLLYGVRFVPGSMFKEAIDAVVGELRGHSAELSMAWRRQN